MNQKKSAKMMTRLQFEKKIQGTWESIDDDRYRQNGDFQTSVHGGWKVIKMKDMALRAKTWRELAKILKLP